jgi:hypothetical protein
MKLTLKLIGEKKVPLPQSKTKDLVDHVGLSQLSVLLKDLSPSTKEL